MFGAARGSQLAPVEEYVPEGYSPDERYVSASGGWTQTDALIVSYMRLHGFCRLKDFRRISLQFTRLSWTESALGVDVW